MVVFGQVVIGPPGSGKSTYCRTLKDAYNGLGRKTIIVNLDAANENTGYTPDVDVCDLITLEDAMAAHGLGPNGGILYCADYLAANVDWLIDQLRQHSDSYILFDCPGQVELYSHHGGIKSVVLQLQKALDLRLCSVHITEALHCADPAKYISLVFAALTAMLHLELPHINILSKADSFAAQFPDIDLEQFTFPDTTWVDMVETPRLQRLTRAIAGVIDDYSCVSFIPLAVNDAHALQRVMQTVDRANGYYYTQGSASDDENGDKAEGDDTSQDDSDPEFGDHARWLKIQEKLMKESSPVPLGQPKTGPSDPSHELSGQSSSTDALNIHDIMDRLR